MLNNTIRAIVEYVKVTCDHSAPPMSPMNTLHAHCKPTVPLLAAHLSRLLKYWFAHR